MTTTTDLRAWAERGDLTMEPDDLARAVLGLLDKALAHDRLVAAVEGLRDEWRHLLTGYADPADRSQGYARGLKRAADRLDTILTATHTDAAEVATQEDQ